ncbi:FtsK/SpoIIIE domain-containing protein [Anaerorhabdus sp.]|uniref:FtsK/SpoIIIE domain-containing protein n=1 Tax=Anaerorhabdus sp. TaxID=1872524 RepID=UPI002FC9F4C4
MICVIHDHKRIQSYYLDKGQQSIKFYEHTVELIINENRYFKMNDLVIHLFEDNGYNYYKKYKKLNQITIGSSEYANIQIQSTRIKSIQCVIECNKNKINDHGFNEVFVNKKIKKEIELFDIIEFDTIKLIYCHDFVMINQCNNVSIYLDEYKVHQSYIKPLYYLHRIIQHKRESFTEPKLTISFRQFGTIQKIEKQPLFFIMFPILLMSCASLLSGALMAYQSYLQGRELVEVLPSLIVPIVMILGSTMIHPLQRRYENKKFKCKLNDREQDIKRYFNELENEVLNYDNQVRIYERKRWLFHHEIMQDIETNARYLQNNNALDLTIPLGIGRMRNNIEFKDIPKENDQFLFSQVKLFLNKYTVLENHIVAIDLNNNKMVTTDSLDILIWICFYLVTQFDDQVISLVYIINQTLLHFLNRITLFSHTVYKNKVLVFDSLKSFQQNQDDDTRLKIIINCSHNYYDGNFPCIQYVDKTVSPQTQCSIRFHENKGILELPDNVIHFSHEIDRNDLMNSINYLFYLLSKNHKNLIRRNDDLINIESLIKYTPFNKWKDTNTIDSLKIIVGYDDKQEPFELDLHESKDGPHLLIAATTGAGKSECIVTILMMLSMQYSFEDVQFVIVDFKGGGLAQSFVYNNKICPHLIGTISNLDNHEIKRFFSSIRIESRRRQTLFNQLSKISNESSMDISKYQRLSSQYQFSKLAHLFVVVDEFAELKVMHNEYIGELISLARIGRSLGIHLILSTQKPSNVIDAQIWSNCRTKISLHVQDKQDSLDMINSDLAFYLQKPGQFYKYTDNELSKGQFYYLNEDISENKKTKVYDLYHQELMRKSKSNQKVLKLMLAKLVDIPCDIRPLWHKPLGIIDKGIVQDAPQSIGMVDDIEHNQQYPYLLRLCHTLFYCKNQNEAKQLFCTTLYSMIHINENIEVFIIDYDQDFYNHACNSNFVHSISNDEMLHNLFKYVMNKKGNDKMDIIVALNTQLFLEKLEIHGIELVKLLNMGIMSNVSIFLFGLTVNILPYSLWGYFKVKIASSFLSTQDLSVVFDEKIKYTSSKEDFYYVNETRVQYFRIYKVDEQDLLKTKSMRLKSKTVIHQMTIPLLTSKKGVVGMSYDTYDWIDINEFPYCIMVAKHTYRIIEYLKIIFPTYSLVQNEEELYSRKNCIVLVSDFQTFDMKRCKMSLKHRDDPIVFCCDHREFSMSWLSSFYQEQYIVWIGNGLSDQYIIPVNRKISIRNDQGYYYHEGKGERIKLIDEVFDSN